MQEASRPLHRDRDQHPASTHRPQGSREFPQMYSNTVTARPGTVYETVTLDTDIQSAISHAALSDAPAAAPHFVKGRGLASPPESR
jgi:hypothetical protein